LGRNYQIQIPIRVPYRICLQNFQRLRAGDSLRPANFTEFYPASLHQGDDPAPSRWDPTFGSRLHLSLFVQHCEIDVVKVLDRENDFNREVFKGAIVTNEKDVSVTLPATVEKVLPARDAEREKIQISVDGCDELFSELRVENTLKNESGDSVTLKRGAHIEVTINADSDAVTKKE
jgi:hypothetical protein